MQVERRAKVTADCLSTLLDSSILSLYLYGTRLLPPVRACVTRAFHTLHTLQQRTFPRGRVRLGMVGPLDNASFEFQARLASTDADAASAAETTNVSW